MYKKVDAFEMWCYRRILKISWFDGVTNAEVLNPNTHEIAFQGRYDEQKIGLCMTCIKGLQRTITFNIRGSDGGKQKGEFPKKVMDEGYS